MIESPCATRRRMSVPLPNLPVGTRALRITTNQEIYWDRLAVVYAEPFPEAIRRQLSLGAARLRTSGFALRPKLPQPRP